MERLLPILLKNGWKMTPSNATERISVDLLNAIPDAIRKFCGLFDELSSPTEIAWFFSHRDFAGTSDSAFKWNEFELNGLECAMNEVQRESVLNFWKVHFPFAMSVKDEYKFLALGVGPLNFGKVFVGEGSDESEIKLLATDFDELANIFQRYFENFQNQDLIHFLE